MTTLPLQRDTIGQPGTAPRGTGAGGEAAAAATVRGDAPGGRDRRPVDLAVYCIVDPEVCRGRPLDAVARAAVGGGATIVQYRDKDGATGRMVATARAIRAALAGTGVPLIINDRVDVALAAGADGVHVGQDDMTVDDVRRLIGPSAIVGLSLNSVAEADAAPLADLDYVVGQCVYGTSSKRDAPPPIGLAGLAEIAAAIRRRDPAMPVGAISGITAETAAAVVQAGADGVAVISAIGAADDPAAAARALRQAVDAGLAAGRAEGDPSATERPAEAAATGGRPPAGAGSETP